MRFNEVLRKMTDKYKDINRTCGACIMMIIKDVAIEAFKAGYQSAKEDREKLDKCNCKNGGCNA